MFKDQVNEIVVPVHTVPDSYGHDMKLNSFKTSVDRKFMTRLHNLMTTNHRKSGKSKYDCKLTILDIVITRIRNRVNGALGTELAIKIW